MNNLLSGQIALDGGIDDARAQRFGQYQVIPGFESLLGEYSLGMDEAGYGKTVFEFIILNAVAPPEALLRPP